MKASRSFEIQPRLPGSMADQYPTLRAQAVCTAQVSYSKKDKEQLLIIERSH